MQDWQQRVVDEKAALDGNIERLNAFINDANKFNGLPCDERVRLTNQEDVMRQYSDILGERIENFA